MSCSNENKDFDSALAGLGFRGLVPRRDAGGSKEQAHLSLGQERFTPRATHDQRTQSTYLFGAVCPERGAGAALVVPTCNCEAMQLHLDEIPTKSPPEHTPFSSLIRTAGMAPQPWLCRATSHSCRCRHARPNSWQFMRQNWLSNRIFKSFDEIVVHRRYAWNTLIDQPWKIMSIARRSGQQSVTQSEDW
jgi:hypothetical protein